MKLTKKIVYLILICNLQFLSCIVYAQQKQLDSLKLALKTANHDTTRCKILAQLVTIAPNGEWEKYTEQLKNIVDVNLQDRSKTQKNSIEFNNNSSLLSPRQRFFKKHLAIAISNKALIFSNSGDKSKALEYYKKSLNIFTELNEKQGIAESLYNIGQVYQSQSNTIKSLEFHKKSLLIREQLGNKYEISESLNDCGVNYFFQGDIIKALSYYEKSLKIKEEIGDQAGIATTLNNLSQVYISQGDYFKALEYLKNCEKKFAEINDKYGLAISLNNISLILEKQGDITSSLVYANKSLKIKEEIGDKAGIAYSINNIAKIYLIQENIPKAFEFYKKSYKLFIEVGDQKGAISALNNMGYLYFKNKNYKVAIEFCLKSLKISKELGFPEIIKNAAEKLNQIYKATGDYKNALNNYELFILMRDSINNTENKKASIKNQLKYEFDKKALADSIQLADTKKLNKAQMAESVAKLKQQKTQRFALIAGLLLVLGFLGYTYKRFLHSNKQKLLIEQQKIIVDQSQKKIMDSINYAKKIQNSILPSSDAISSIFPHHFIFFKPKDIVSGDFYWFYHHADLSFIAVADCTGHGVPGAFMTMIASAGLNEVIMEQKITQPELILSNLHSTIFKGLQQHKGDEYSQDGLDISLAVIDHKNNLLHFSGAHNHGFLIDNGEIRTLKATSKSIGGLNILGEIEPQRNFKAETYQLNKDTVLVLATDGIYDQLNSQDEKFGIQRFKDLMLKINSDNYLDNQNIIEQTYDEWKQETLQLDDVLLLTIKF